MADKTRGRTYETMRSALVDAHFQCIRNIYQSTWAASSMTMATLRLRKLWFINCKTSKTV